MLLTLTACTTLLEDTGLSDTGGPAGADYDAVAAELAGYRTRFLGEEGDELAARGNRLFWLTFPGFDPVLHSALIATDPADDGRTVDYAFSIGAETYNYRGSEEMVVTAATGGRGITYTAYAAGAEGDELGTTSFDEPSSGARWHAYAADGTTAYVVVESYEETALYRWDPPAEPERQWSFDELGYELGEFQDFDVEGDTMIFIESGRIWRANVNNGRGEWLGNPTAITGVVAYDDEGVVWAGDYDLYWYNYAAGGQPVNLTDTINTADYRLSRTEDSAHKIVETGFSRLGNRLVYEAYSGIYLYDLGTGDFEPIVLEERGASVRVTWRDPVLLENGVLFANGLESESGSVGADGPMWRIDHPALQ